MHSPVAQPTSRHLLITLALIILAGAALRLTSLGAAQLTTAELPWHLAAQSVAHGGPPVLPSGVTFDRSMPMIRAVAGLQGALRKPETSARVPAAVIGTLSLFLMAGLAWLIAGPWAAIGATFLLAFYPEAVVQSRTAGLYSQQQFLGILALGAGWLATSRSGPQTSSSPADLIRRWIWAAIALAAFALATLAHLSAATVFAGFTAWVCLLAAVSLWIHGPAAIIRNLAIQLMILGVLGLVAAFIMEPGLVPAVLEKIRVVPSSAPDGQPSSGSSLYYVQAFASQFGWVLTLLPVLVLLVIRNYTWLCIYLLLWFLVPLVAHSFFIARKEERLLLMAAPALFLIAGLAYSEGRELLAREVGSHAREWLRSYRSAVRAGTAVVTGMLAFILLALPAFYMSLALPGARPNASIQDWTALRRFSASVPGIDNLPLGAVEPLVAYHYFGRADFAVGGGLNYLPRDLLDNRPAGRFRPAVDSVTVEKQTAALMLRTMDELRSAYAPYGEVHLLVDPRDMVTPIMDRSVVTALLNAEELCQGRCGRFRLFRVKLSQ